jgi:hypothetical protein
MHWLVNEQKRRNAGGQSRWSAYTRHRQELAARLLRPAPSPPGPLCVLGAGNCDDLELASLTRRFPEVHLVDIDSEALEGAASRQSEADRSGLRLHGGVDLTGCWDKLNRPTSGKALSDAEVAEAIRLAEQGAAADFGGPFSAVASTCVVSQLIDSAVLSLGEHHPRLLELIIALRTAHLRLLCRLTAPGGRAVLATDFVSSVTVPELNAAIEPDWRALLADILPRSNFFHGLNPLVLLSLFQSDQELSQCTGGAEFTGFWRWNQGSRIYAVCAIEFTRMR